MMKFPEFIQGSTASVLFFCLIMGAVCFHQYYLLKSLIKKDLRHYALTQIVWIAVVSLAAASGATRNFFPYSIPIILLITISITIFFSFSKFGKALTSISPKTLILASSFRFPLELVLHSWSDTGTIPETMTWTGSNFDIIPGILALFVFIPLFNKNWFYKLFTFISIAMLLNVMRVVLMSANLPFSWKLENPIQLVFEWPYCLIAVVLVPWAFQLNIALIKKLFFKET